MVATPVDYRLIIILRRNTFRRPVVRRRTRGTFARRPPYRRDRTGNFRPLSATVRFLVDLFTSVRLWTDGRLE